MQSGFGVHFVYAGVSDGFKALQPSLGREAMRVIVRVAISCQNFPYFYRPLNMSLEDN